jgi:hypothetical protein
LEPRGSLSGGVAADPDDPGQAPELIEPLALDELVTERGLQEIGIHTLTDLAAADPASGRPVRPHRPGWSSSRAATIRGRCSVAAAPKSVSNETTFEEDTTDQHPQPADRGERQRAASAPAAAVGLHDLRPGDQIGLDVNVRPAR